VDFSDDWVGEQEVIWDYPVCHYVITYELISSGMAHGWMTLDYQDHVYGGQHAPRTAFIEFTARMAGGRPRLLPAGF